jgi:hypothetical protein
MTDEPLSATDTMRADEIRAKLERQRRASDTGDFAAEHYIHGEEAVLIYPQSGE